MSNPSQQLTMFETSEIERFPHYCHALNCKREVDPKLLMCPEHWRKVPYLLKQEVLRFYRPGQEKDKKPFPRISGSCKAGSGGGRKCQVGKRYQGFVPYAALVRDRPAWQGH